MATAPDRRYRSIGFRAVAPTRTRTSPGPGSGAGSSPTRIASAGPVDSMNAARMSDLEEKR
jgi:hypothetical protein